MTEEDQTQCDNCSGNTLPEYQYNDRSDLVNKEGFNPHLTVAQLLELENLKDLIKSEVGDEAKNEEAVPENEKLRLLRFLRARQFDASSAFEMIKAEKVWRNQEDMQILKNMPVDEASFELLGDVFNGKALYLFEQFPTWMQGIDYQGRPVVWRMLGKASIDHCLQFTTMEKLMQSQIWTRDQGGY